MIWCHLLFWCHHPSLPSSSICQHSGVKHSVASTSLNINTTMHPSPTDIHPLGTARMGNIRIPLDTCCSGPNRDDPRRTRVGLAPRPRSPRPVKGGGFTQAPSFLLRISPNGPRLPEAADGAGDLLSSVSEGKSHNKNKDAPAGFGVGGWVWEWLFHSCSCLYCSLLGMISRRRQGSHVSGVSFPSFP